MAVSRAMSLSLLGIDAVPVEVEVDVSAGLPGFSIVGLPDAAVQEARERVRVAISNSGFKFPTRKVIVNLAPANLLVYAAVLYRYPNPLSLAWCTVVYLMVYRLRPIVYHSFRFPESLSAALSFFRLTSSLSACTSRPMRRR